mmetsp:Transcript_41229/g.106636  ORF Transcript_41229/g.106636 Transcript_41229/m.106636 type:complete len:128 (+) Transcript_41229:139-522(+)
MDDHRVHRWVSLAGPNMGEYGTPSPEWLRKYFPDIALEELYTLWYTGFSQDHISFAGYWNDPNQYDGYLKKVEFLPHQEVVLLGSPVDEIILPWDSSLFNFFTPSNEHTTSSMKTMKVRKHMIYFSC